MSGVAWTDKLIAFISIRYLFKIQSNQLSPIAKSTTSSTVIGESQQRKQNALHTDLQGRLVVSYTCHSNGYGCFGARIQPRGLRS